MTVKKAAMAAAESYRAVNGALFREGYRYKDLIGPGRSGRAHNLHSHARREGVSFESLAFEHGVDPSTLRKHMRLVPAPSLDLTCAAAEIVLECRDISFKDLRQRLEERHPELRQRKDEVHEVLFGFFMELRDAGKIQKTSEFRFKLIADELDHPTADPTLLLEDARKALEDAAVCHCRLAQQILSGEVTRREDLDNQLCTFEARKPTGMSKQVFNALVVASIQEALQEAAQQLPGDDPGEIVTTVLALRHD